MILDGQQMVIGWGYTATVDQKYQSSWIQTSGGNFETNDRAFTDRRQAEFRTVELLGDVEQIAEAMLATRTKEWVWLECDEVAETIFGPEVDHSLPMKVTVLDVGSLSRENLKMGNISIKLELAQAPTLLAGSGSGLSALIYKHQHEVEIDPSVRYNALSGGSASITYSSEIVRKFSASFELEDAEARDVLLYLQQIRAGIATLPDLKYLHPFGEGITGPYHVRVLKWGPVLRESLRYWSLRMDIAMENT